MVKQSISLYTVTSLYFIICIEEKTFIFFFADEILCSRGDFPAS